MEFKSDYVVFTFVIAVIAIFFKILKYLAWLGKKKHQKRIANGAKYVFKQIKPFEGVLDKIFLYGCIFLSFLFIFYGVSAAGITYTKYQNVFIALLPILLATIVSLNFLIRSIQLYRTFK